MRTLRQAKVHFRVNGDASRQSDLLHGGDASDCSDEAGGPAGCEQLLGIGAITRLAGNREIDVQATIVGAGAATVAATGAVRFRRVQNFLEMSYRSFCCCKNVSHDRLPSGD